MWVRNITGVLIIGVCSALVQDWLSDSARKIAKAGHPVLWTTPMGLPVIQPYHKASKLKRVSTAF